MSYRQEETGRYPFVEIAFIVAAVFVLVFTVSATGCGPTSEMQLKERQERAFDLVSNAVWVRMPDIKGMCFGVADGPHGGGYGFVIPCEYVAHKLVNPPRPDLPGKEPQR